MWQGLVTIYNRVPRAWRGDGFEIEHVEVAETQKRGALMTAVKVDREAHDAVFARWVDADEDGGGD